MSKVQWSRCRNYSMCAFSFCSSCVQGFGSVSVSGARTYLSHLVSFQGRLTVALNHSIVHWLDRQRKLSSEAVFNHAGIDVWCYKQISPDFFRSFGRHYLCQPSHLCNIGCGTLWRGICLYLKLLCHNTWLSGETFTYSIHGAITGLFIWGTVQAKHAAQTRNPYPFFNRFITGSQGSATELLCFVHHKYGQILLSTVTDLHSALFLDSSRDLENSRDVAPQSQQALWPCLFLTGGLGPFGHRDIASQRQIPSRHPSRIMSLW